MIGTSILDHSFMQTSKSGCFISTIRVPSPNHWHELY